MAGRDPIFPACLRAKSPSWLRGSRPAMEIPLRFLVRRFAAHEDSRSGFKPNAGIVSLQTTVTDHAAPELFRQRDQRYPGHVFDQMYQDWATKGLSPTEVNALVNPSPEQPKMAFKTHLLPESYDILDHVSVRKNRRGSGTLRGNALSTNDSAPSSTSGTRKCLQAQEQTHHTTSNTDAGKNLLWPGATPTFGARITPKSLRASEVAPGHSAFALQANLQ